MVQQLRLPHLLPQRISELPSHGKLQRQYWDHCPPPFQIGWQKEETGDLGEYVLSQ